jgi:hypothetical protein
VKEGQILTELLVQAGKRLSANQLAFVVAIERAVAFYLKQNTREDAGTLGQRLYRTLLQQQL